MAKPVQKPQSMNALAKVATPVAKQSKQEKTAPKKAQKATKTRGATPLMQIVHEIEKADKIAFFHHIHPDGDTLSSSYGLMLAVKAKYPKKHLVYVGNLPDLRKSLPFVDFDEQFFVKSIDSSYLAVVGDTGSLKRIEYAEEFMKAGRKVCFDHHRNPIDFKADVYWSEPHYVASAMQANEIVEKLGVKLDENLAYHLMIGLLTDSNNFSYSRANPKPPLMYSWLLWHISDEKMDEFFRLRYMRTQEEIKVTRIVLSHIKYDGQVAYVYVKHRFAERHGRELVKSRVSTFGNIKGYPIWVLFLERRNPDGKIVIEAHIRSIKAEIVHVAIAFGGGGHGKAAGADLAAAALVPQMLAELNKVKT